MEIRSMYRSTFGGMSMIALWLVFDQASGLPSSSGFPRIQRSVEFGLSANPTLRCIGPGFDRDRGDCNVLRRCAAAVHDARSHVSTPPTKCDPEHEPQPSVQLRESPA